MKKGLIPIACLMTMFAACTDIEVAEKGISSDIVSFSTYMGQSTRAAATTTANFTNFGVSAYYADEVWDTSKGDASCNYMKNDKVTGNSVDGWAYSYPKYWPKAGYVNFWAWSPAESANIVWAQETGVPNFTYTVADAVASQEDLVVALATDKQKDADGKVSLNFGHLLSKIGFSAKLAAVYSPAVVNVTAMEVAYKANTVKKAGKYTYDPAPEADIWAAPSGGDQYHSASPNALLATKTAALSNTDATLLNDANKYLMLLPQTTSDGALSAKITYTVTYTDGVVTTNVKTVDLPGQEWKAGKQYTYNFTISLTGVEFDVIAVTPWNDATVVQINDKPIAEFAGAPVAVGYAANSQNSFATSGISRIDAVENDDYSVTYQASGARSISDVAGTITFTAKTENTTAAVKTTEIPVTVYDVLGNKSTVTFTLSQAAKIDILNGSASISASPQTLVYNSSGSLFSVNGTQTSSVSYAIAGVSNENQVIVGNYDTNAFTVTKSTTALTIVAKSLLSFGADSKKTSVTVTLNDAEGQKVGDYTFALEQCALPVMKVGGVAAAAGNVPTINFKSTKEKGSSETLTGADFVNVNSVSGTFVSNNDFEVTRTTAVLVVTAKNSLEAAGNSNKKLEGTIVLANKCGETTTYNLSAEQYAAAYLNITKKDGSVCGDLFASATANTQNVRFKSGISYYTCYIESKFASYTAPKVGDLTLILTAGDRGVAKLAVQKDRYGASSQTITITLFNALNEPVSYALKVSPDAIVSNGDKWE